MVKLGVNLQLKRRTLLQAALGATFLPSGYAARTEPSMDAAAEVLEQACGSGQVKAASMFVDHRGMEWSKGFGTAQNADAIFLLASISKPISIAAVMSLYDEGHFRLDDPVSRFLPEFQGDGRETVTMQQLMTHNSGLPDQLLQNAELRAAHAPLSEFVSGALRTPLLFRPGTKYSYSSMAILLACEVAQRITGKPIAELVDERVVKPLELKRSALGVGHLNRNELMPVQTEFAAPESGAGKAGTSSWDWNSDYWRRLGAPWGTAHGSVADVGHFLKAFLRPDGRLLKPETARMMIQNHNPKDMRPRGLGFDLGRQLGGERLCDQTFGHTGSTGTLCWADPVSDVICVILTTLPGRAVTPHPRTLASAKLVETL